MIADKMRPLVENNSAIRAMFEEGKKMAAQFGPENVFDFSLGNPNVPAPEAVREAIFHILEEEPSVFVHGYMSNAGFEDVREAVAENLNRRFATAFHRENIIMTVGAAGGMNVILKTILDPGDEVVVFAPYFMEYGSYVRNYDGSLVVISPKEPDFQPNLTEFEEKITARTKAVIINTPNNPTGAVYPAETLKEIGAVLRQKEERFHTSIVLISDEPYRELAYDGVEVPYVTPFYHNTAVCYSYSKSLSLPGERIGYLVIPDELEDSEKVIAAAAIANRVLGCVNAPSLMQRVIGRCVEEKVDLQAYEKNRNLLYEGLLKCGFTMRKPEGAFYLFVKAPGGDDGRFCQVLKKYRILAVPGTSFACPGYVRIAYCVSYSRIESSLPAFAATAKEYGLGTESQKPEE